MFQDFLPFSLDYVFLFALSVTNSFHCRDNVDSDQTVDYPSNIENFSDSTYDLIFLKSKNISFLARGGGEGPIAPPPPDTHGYIFYFSAPECFACTKSQLAEKAVSEIDYR
jgi:hypothetical protein